MVPSLKPHQKSLIACMLCYTNCQPFGDTVRVDPLDHEVYSANYIVHAQIIPIQLHDSSGMAQL